MIVISFQLIVIIKTLNYEIFLCWSKEKPVIIIMSWIGVLLRVARLVAELFARFGSYTCNGGAFYYQKIEVK